MSNSRHSCCNLFILYIFLSILSAEKPSVLFEVQCGEHDLQLGGVRLHYIFKPFKGIQDFNVVDFESGQKVGGRVE